MKMTKPKILIMGATGFIGRNTLEHLAERARYEVFATCNRRPSFNVDNVTWIQADLTDAADVSRVVQGQDVIVQAAATTSGSKDIVSKPFIHTTDNAVINSLVFRAAHEHNVKHVVFLSCTIMYPSSPVPLKETDFDANAGIHGAYFGAGWTKVYLEKMAEFYAGLKRTKYSVFRHSNMYGPHDKYDFERSHVYGATVSKVMTNTDGKIVVWGTGEAERDLLYIDDLVEAIGLAVENQKEPFALLNIGYGEAVSVNQLVRSIIKASGKKLDIVHDTSKPAIYTKLCLDCSLAEETIGWKRSTSLENGTLKTMEWFKKNVDISKLGSPN